MPRKLTQEEFIQKANQKHNNINLLRIPYTEFSNIEVILQNYLKHSM